jgi:uncharacterized protein YciI
MPRLSGVEFLCYHRDRVGSGPLRDALLELHWSYMDRYAQQMIARGPTLTPDGEHATGSIHALRLPDPAAARAFALEEPYYRAGVFRDVLLRRWHNLLGRTMWDFPGGRTGGTRYLVLALGPQTDEPVTLPHDTSEVIAYGPLLTDDDAGTLGTAALVRATGAEAARAVLEPKAYAEVEVHRWQFGGRPD